MRNPQGFSKHSFLWMENLWGILFEYSLSIHFSDLIQIRGKAFYYWLRLDQFNHSAKAQKPAEGAFIKR